MADEGFTLTTFYKQWKDYQEHIKESIAPLTDEQLALDVGTGLRTIGQNAMHIASCRAGWFTYTLGEDGGADVKAVAHWEEPGSPTRSAAEIAQALDSTWQFMADCLARWSPADMEQTVPDDWDGEIVQLSRAWIVWHVMEHDLHHGGVISLTLGAHGIPASFTS